MDISLSSLLFVYSKVFYFVSFVCCCSFFHKLILPIGDIGLKMNIILGLYTIGLHNIYMSYPCIATNLYACRNFVVKYRVIMYYVCIFVIFYFFVLFCSLLFSIMIGE